MPVTNEEVKYIADLARLQFTDKETEKLAGEMNKILEYMETLQEVNTSGVAPLEHVISSESSFREDKAAKPLPHEKALKNAPDTDGDYFRVPRVIE